MKEDLVRKLASKDLGERLEAVKSVGDLERDSGIPLLIGMLRDKSNHVVAAAVKALERYGAREAIGPLIHTYGRLKGNNGQQDPGCVGRWQIVTTLTKIVADFGVNPGSAFMEEGGDDGKAESGQPFSTVKEVLHDAIETVQIERSGHGLDDMAVGLRGQAALGLAETESEGALMAIALLLFDVKPPPELLKPPGEEPFVTLLARRSAARALSVLGDPGGVALLAVKLAHPSQELPELLVECMDSIAFLDGDAALKLIPPFLHYGDYGESASNLYLTAGAATALASLAEMYHEQVMRLLIDVCQHSMLFDVKESVAMALASMRSDIPYKGLQQMAEDSDPQVRLAAVNALAARRSERSVAILRMVRDNEVEPEIASAAGKVLRSIE